MKFGKQLETSLIRDYYYYYISYDDLKRVIKTTLAKHPWSEADEEHFLSLLEEELEKVYTFQKVKSGEIKRRIKDIEADVNGVVRAIDSSSNPPQEEDFEILEEELSDIIADVHDLTKFTRLNYTGFQKILKKHDKQTKWHLKPIFQTRLNAKPFYANDYDPLVIKLSNLYNLVRTRGNPVSGDSAAGGSQQNFVRQTTKYWVHPDNITELKLIILKHLPVLVFNASKEFEKEDSAITSIYYDNADLKLYKGRLEKEEGAQAVRLRWYGGMNSDLIFVERKTHREDWTGEKSVKARFTLKEKNVNAFMRGQYTVDQAFEKMRKDNKKPIKEIESLEQLGREVQYTVITENLKPTIRSFYNRTAFQLPGDARVRISLDTELTMVREDSFDGKKRAGHNWRRMDIGVDWPFPELPDSDVCRFPYAVLEIKLQTQMGQEAPQWVRDLVASHLVEAVPKFSKFIHGTATLLPDKVKLLPYWLPQMDVDILKPASEEVGIKHPSNALNSNNDSHNQTGYDEEELVAGSSSTLFNANNNSEATESTPLLSNRSTNRHRADFMKNKFFVVFLKAFQPFVFLYGKVSHIFAFDQGIQVNNTTKFVTIQAPPGKKIWVPVRIEPKVYFANERTFLSWLEISIIIVTIASALLEYGSDAIIPVAFGFYITAVLITLYSVGVYLWRGYMIRKRRAINYDDRIGPTVICFVFFVAIFANYLISF